MEYAPNRGNNLSRRTFIAGPAPKPTPPRVIAPGPRRRCRIVAYQVHYLGNGREEICCSSGRTCQILRHQDGTWTVPEDVHDRIFPNRDDALDCARELAGDPDLPPLTQI